MKMFVWDQDVLKYEWSGAIIVMAENLGQALEHLRASRPEDPWLYNEVKDKKPNAVHDAPAHWFYTGTY
jgi:hypothetical protein